MKAVCLGEPRCSTDFTNTRPLVCLWSAFCECIHCIRYTATCAAGFVFSAQMCVCVSRWWLFNRGMQCPSSRQTALLFLQQREHVSSLSTQDVGLDLLKKKIKAQPASPTPIIPIFQQEQWNTSPQPPPFPGASSTWFPQYYRVLRSRAIVSRPTCPLIVPMRIHTHTQFSVNSGAFSCKPHLHLSIFISFKWKLPPA